MLKQTHNENVIIVINEAVCFENSRLRLSRGHTTGEGKQCFSADRAALRRVKGKDAHNDLTNALPSAIVNQKLFRKQTAVRLSRVTIVSC